MDHDVPTTDDTALRAVQVVAELPLRVHGPPPVTESDSCVTFDARWTRLLSISTSPEPLIHGGMGCYHGLQKVVQLHPFHHQGIYPSLDGCVHGVADDQR